MDREALALLGIRMVVEVDSIRDEAAGGALFEPSSLVAAIQQMIKDINDKGASSS